ncbi:hypothetical protein ACEQ6A_34750, partial [Rhizobium brockwellii]|uniref:hypothetical protein n=1 Tax=Rhizobium brockwellii TaxID=3019932 RepID=UPI003F94A463
VFDQPQRFCKHDITVHLVAGPHHRYRHQPTRIGRRRHRLEQRRVDEGVQPGKAHLRKGGGKTGWADSQKLVGEAIKKAAVNISFTGREQAGL